MPRTPSGRPEPGEYADYMAEVFRSFASRADHAYAPGKWTVKQFLGHLIDDERIYAYRWLCVAREEPLALPGFDENLYVRTAGFEDRSLENLLEECAAVRLAFFRGVPEVALRRSGVANGYCASVRGLGFQIAAHERHHLWILKERYRG